MRRIVPRLVTLAACGGPAPPEPPDPTLARQTRVAMLAWQQDRPAQAAALFRDALARAYARDDLAAIADIAASLAAVELRLGEAEAARDIAAGARAEVNRRGGTMPAELPLAEAAARWRLGDVAGARALTAAITEGEAGARARFIEGLIAADARDAQALATARASLPPTDVPDLLADSVELDGRTALLAGDAGSARAALLRAAALRQEARDYPGMARALALAGEAAAREGRAAEAADLALRAGGTAGAHGDARAAGQWVAQAGGLARAAGSADVLAAAEAEQRRLAVR
ncbi:hypothetical protein [Elioraea sp.]|uniref:hypothetical protein n=1 Tax=Elioraea sp. TaxID=2185103 RepID=UPI003F7301DE